MVIFAKKTSAVMKLFKERSNIMEFKRGDKTIKVPGWVIAAGIVTLGTMVGDICKVRIENHK